VNKFSDLKKWLTVPEAAKRLSNYFGEDITEADVLQQALDGHFKISINIVSPVKARCTKVVERDETEWLMLRNIGGNRPLPELTFGNPNCPPFLQTLWEKIPEGERRSFFPALCGRQIDAMRYLVVDQGITEITGIYDLPMIGDERLDVEHEYHLLTGGPVVGLQSMDAVFVEDENGVLWQLQSHQNLQALPREVSVQLRRLKEQVCSQKIKRSAMKELLAEHEHRYRAEYSQSRDRELDKPFPYKDEAVEYEPAHSLPDDAVLVLRSTALREFEQLMNEAPSGNEGYPTVDSRPKPNGHLNLDPSLQVQANAIAADHIAKSVIKRAPTKERVAKTLAEKLGMDPMTVMRRIRKQW
jgi:hypothetical protein